jgi:hypothetical protein
MVAVEMVASALLLTMIARAVLIGASVTSYCGDCIGIPTCAYYSIARLLPKRYLNPARGHPGRVIS